MSADDLLLLGERAFEAIVFANDDSFAGSINGVGDTVAFVSFANNLLARPENFILGINNVVAQAYVRNVTTGANELVSVNFVEGDEAPAKAMASAP